MQVLDPGYCLVRLRFTFRLKSYDLKIGLRVTITAVIKVVIKTRMNTVIEP